MKMSSGIITFPFSLPGWSCPPPSSDRWDIQSIPTSFPVDAFNFDNVPSAVALVLRMHRDEDTAVTFDIVQSAQRTRLTAEFSDDMTIGQLQTSIQSGCVPCPPDPVVLLIDFDYPHDKLVELSSSLGASLLVTLSRNNEYISLNIVFDSRGVRTDEAGWFLLHLENALRSLRNGSSDEKILSITLTTLPERILLHTCSTPNQLGINWQRYGGTPSKTTLLYEFFTDRVKFSPILAALSWMNDPDAPYLSLTYLEVYSVALRLASSLIEAGLTPNSIVPICVTDSAALAVSMLSVLFAGGAYAVMDADSVLREMALADSIIPTCDIVLADNASELLHVARCIDPKVLMHKALHTQWPAELPSPVQLTSASDDPAYYVASGDASGSCRYIPMMHCIASDLVRQEFSRLDSKEGSRTILVNITDPEVLQLSIWNAFTHGSTIYSSPSDGRNLGIFTFPLDIFTYLMAPHTHISVIYDVFSGLESANKNDITALVSRMEVVVVASKGDKQAFEGFQHDLALRGIFPSLYSPDPLYSSLSHLTVQRQERTALLSVPRTFPITILLPIDKTPIIAATDVVTLVDTGICIHEVGSTRVVKITDDLVVKYGGDTNINEAQTMIFVKDHCTVLRVPEVHLVFERDHRIYIVMHYVDGLDLQHTWDSLDSASRKLVMSQLAAYLHEMRNLHYPRTAPGPLDGNICHGRWFTFYGAGPFQTHSQLVNWFNHKLDISSAHTAEKFTTNCPLVLTHQDIAPRNLILDKDGTLWIIDWGWAGWYPAYIEYAAIKSAATNTGELPALSGWLDEVLCITDAYEQEYQSLKVIEWVLEIAPFEGRENSGGDGST